MNERSRPSDARTAHDRTTNPRTDLNRFARSTAIAGERAAAQVEHRMAAFWVKHAEISRDLMRIEQRKRGG